jgi:N6-L-threonylcarbamoyladenine synthase
MPIVNIKRSRPPFVTRFIVSPVLLAVESSCDESALALFDPARGVVWSAVHSQIPTHTVHGGVVPELAVREHVKKFPELMAALPVGMDQITEIVVTVGPGLVGSLAIGLGLAHALEVQTGLPLRGVNHLRGHAFAPFIELHKANPASFLSRLQGLLPHLGLVVSGGNTLLVEISQVTEAGVTLCLLARTRDDAAGEALDKAAKLMGLGYPGGPMMEKLAREAGAEARRAFAFPVAFKEARADELGFSFSGLKTALRYQLERMSAAEVEAQKPALAASFQEAVVDSLRLMVHRALRLKPYRSLGLGGGVAQNGRLREVMSALAAENGLELLLAPPAYCGDNAGMIAFAGWLDRSGEVPAHSFLPSLKITNEV